MISIPQYIESDTDFFIREQVLEQSQNEDFQMQSLTEELGFARNKASCPKMYLRKSKPYSATLDIIEKPKYWKFK